MKITEEQVRQLSEQARQGRGLWVGLFMPADGSLRSHGMSLYMPEDAHVTLLHLGKDRTAEDVEILCEAVEIAWSCLSETDHQRSLSAELTGIGMFWRRYAPTPVGLVNSAQMFALRATLIGLLGDKNVAPNDAFGFIPHVTLKDFSFESSSYHSWKSVRFNFPMITVVCGNVKASIG